MKDTKALLVKMSIRLHMALKIEAAKRNMSMTEIINTIINHWLKEQEKYR